MVARRLRDAVARWLVLLAEIVRPAAESAPVPAGTAVGSGNEQWLALVRDRASELLTGGGIRAGMDPTVHGSDDVVPAPAVTSTGAPVRPARGVWRGGRTGVPVWPSAASVLRRAHVAPGNTAANSPVNPAFPAPSHPQPGNTAANSPAPGHPQPGNTAANFRPAGKFAAVFPGGRGPVRRAPEPYFDPPSTPSPGLPLFDEPRSPLFGPPRFPEADAASVGAAVFGAPPPDRWPDLPDDSAQWTAPRTAFDHDHLRRLDDEQRGR